MADVPALSPDEARALLRECAAVVAPGETLVIRLGNGWAPRQARALQDYLADLDLPFRAVLVPGEELGVCRPASSPLEDEVTVTSLGTSVRMVHVPSGTAAEAESEEQAAGALAAALAKDGRITARDVRQAPAGVPPAVAEASLRARVAAMVGEMLPGMLAREMQRQASAKARAYGGDAAGILGGTGID